MQTAASALMCAVLRVGYWLYMLRCAEKRLIFEGVLIQLPSLPQYLQVDATVLGALLEPWRLHQAQAGGRRQRDGEPFLCPAVPGCDEAEMAIGCEAALDNADTFR